MRRDNFKGLDSLFSLVRGRIACLFDAMRLNADTQNTGQTPKALSRNISYRFNILSGDTLFEDAFMNERC